MDAEWIFDDPSIPDETLLYRRVTKHPDNLVPDLETGRWTVGIALFTYRGDGLSIYASCLMEQEQISDIDLIDWDRERLARFETRVVRRGERGDPFVNGHPPAGTVAPGEEFETPGGVVACVSEHDGDSRVQRSHGLVRIALKPETRDAKKYWNAFRVKLISTALIKAAPRTEWSTSIEK